ncbi:MAG: DUF1127 domain-containing protein [Roseitalea porphyridii]|uniref:DUF1127 domain-containing protein n=1 Tax=Roseitalea porphyridii TaxID=1852022 RepID=UPI0032D95F72
MEIIAMGTIGTIPFRFRPFTIAGVRYDTASAVPFLVWGRVLVAMIVAKFEKRRTRIHLSKLGVEELRDVGLTPDQADSEIRKSLPFFERSR